MKNDKEMLIPTSNASLRTYTSYHKEAVGLEPGCLFYTWVKEHGYSGFISSPLIKSGILREGIFSI